MYDLGKVLKGPSQRISMTAHRCRIRHVSTVWPIPLALGEIHASIYLCINALLYVCFAYIVLSLQVKSRHEQNIAEVSKAMNATIRFWETKKQG